MSAPRLVNIGSAVVDYIYRIGALPAAGTERIAASYDRMVGGGFNMMVAARRCGMPVAFGGQHGSGPNGDFLRAALSAEGIETLTEPSAGIDTGNCVVMITADAERTFVSWPGAEGVVTPAQLDDVKLKADDWVVVSGYTLSYASSRDALAGWIEALPDDIPFVFDPTPVIAEIPPSILRRVLGRVTWLSCNEAEAAHIAGRGDVESNADALLAQHCRRAKGVVLRGAEKGCFVGLADGGAAPVPGFRVDAIDTNGAGDTHIGAFVAALARGAPPFDAARYANAAAAISVTRRGGSSAPLDDEIRAFLLRRSAEATKRNNANTVGALKGDFGR